MGHVIICLNTLDVGDEAKLMNEEEAQKAKKRHARAREAAGER